MSTNTTVKVPTRLRDRLAARARARGTTLAGALEQVLDATEEQEFWEAVRRQNATSTPDELSGVALRDDLGDVADDALGREGW